MNPGIIIGPGIQYEAVSKPSGHIIIEGHQVADTLKCVHCQYTWVVIRGSGIRRGWCQGCFGATCGKDSCDPCMPWEKKLDDMEKR